MDQKIFERDHYLNQLLVASAHSDILVVTGLRKAGKSTLAKDLFCRDSVKRNSSTEAT